MFWAGYSTGLVYTKTIIHLSGGEKRWVFTEPLCNSVNIHDFSPRLRLNMLNYAWNYSNFIFYCDV